MKKILLLLLVHFGLFAQNQSYSLIHSQLHIQPDFKTKSVIGKAAITLKINSENIKELVFDAKDFEIYEVRSEDFSLDYHYDGLKLSVLPDLISRDTVTVEISYKANLSKPDSETQRQGFYFVETTDILGNDVKQFYTHGQTSDNRFWFPTIDRPNQKHTQDIYITLDSHFESLSNGILVSSEDHNNGFKTDRWVQDKPHAPYLTMVAGGNFVKVVDSDFKDFELSYYLEPAYAAYAHNIFGHTGEMINYFENLLDVPFPWDKYAQMSVQDFVTQGMENTSATLYNSSVLKDSIQIIENNNDQVIAHELFHQWFGNLVTPADWGQVVLSEALARYGEYLWTEHKYGADEMEFNNMIDWKDYLDSEIRNPLIQTEYDSEIELFRTEVYVKGGLVIHALRNLVGDKVFFRALNVYLTENAFKTVTLNEFRNVFERISGRDLSWFFNQWFFSSHYPELKISQGFEGGRQMFSVEQLMPVSSENSNQFFRIDLPVKIVTQNSVIDTLFHINEQFHTFIIETDSPVLNYIANPDGFFPGVITDDRDPVQYLNEGDGVYSVISGANKYREMLGSEDEEVEIDSQLKARYKQMLKHDFWRVRQSAVDEFYDYDGNDFLEVEQLLEDVIKNDPDPRVRADALSAVKYFMNPYHVELAREALKEDSYLLKAAALEILFEHEVDDADALALKYENSISNEVFFTVINHYVEKETPGKTEMILNRLKTLGNVETYQYSGLLTSYLLVVDPDSMDECIPFFKDISIAKRFIFTRFGGLTALYTLQYYSESAADAFKEAIQHPLNADLVDYFIDYND